MANRPNKQKRQRQNRQVREARRARSERAGEATAVWQGEREAVSQTESVRGAGKATKGGKGAREPRPRKSPFTVPGQRAVVMALLFAVVSGITLLMAPVGIIREVPADDPVLEEVDEDDITDRDEDAGTVSYRDEGKLLDEEGPAVAAGVILMPIIITGAAVWFTKRPQRSTAWTMALLAMAAYVFFFAGPYGIIMLPAMIALAVGGFQSRRVESKARLAELRAKKAARERGEGDVIDVEAVEDAGDADAEPAGDLDQATDVDDASDAPIDDDERR